MDCTSVCDGGGVPICELFRSCNTAKSWHPETAGGGSCEAAVSNIRCCTLPKHRQKCLCHTGCAGSTPWRRGAASEGSQGLSEATPLEKERRPEVVPRQRHWKRSLICNCAQVLVPLTRHEFKTRRRIEGCSQKALAPLATFCSRSAAVGHGTEPVTPISSCPCW